MARALLSPWKGMLPCSPNTAPCRDGATSSSFDPGAEGGEAETAAGGVEGAEREATKAALGQEVGGAG